MGENNDLFSETNPSSSNMLRPLRNGTVEHTGGYFLFEDIKAPH